PFKGGYLKLSAYESFLEWDLSFLHDGEFLIDNNWAERSIRQLTILRNSSLHYASDVGIKMVSSQKLAHN
ncbi:IS66 family transposase, partial [Phocaeicola vulgatus]|uniref:IS66 family transposase n=1 Tax=Phocaeicola vulgatus TaxID=821 RepID=UPI001C707430